MRERKVKSTESEFMDRASDIVNHMADTRLFVGMNIEIDARMRALRFETNNGVVMYYPIRGVWQYKQNVFEVDSGKDVEFYDWIQDFYLEDRVGQKHRRHGPSRRQRDGHERVSL